MSGVDEHDSSKTDSSAQGDFTVKTPPHIDKDYVALVACRGCGMVRMSSKQCRCPEADTWPVSGPCAEVDREEQKKRDNQA